MKDKMVNSVASLRNTVNSSRAGSENFEVFGSSEMRKKSLVKEEIKYESYD